MEIQKAPLIARGRTAEVYSRNETEILKLFYDWCEPAWSAREAKISRLVFARGLPTPECLETVELDGRRGLVYRRVRGPSMLSAMSRSPWLVTTQANVFAELHFRVHSENGVGLRGVRTHLEAAIEKADIPAELRRRALQVLSELPDGSSLCHFDFHPDQVILSESGPVIIDWMSALEGDPMADVARTIVLLKFASPPKASWIHTQAVNLMRNSFLRRYLGTYGRLGGPEKMNTLGRWLIPVAAARLRDDISGERSALLRFLDTAPGSGDDP